ncbi:MAG TPA: tetratricopeptide repeat protein [Pyrinomonadaceae bacterium]|nr:tetratricopeptide repeat protein [Pyrinomonadaceae bacterium]
MAFDKSRAMRNAERYLAQGKLRAAITEYEQVVENDPKDFGTLNLLGDLYSKVSETKAAIACYTTVAEHYSKQGFAQKAIAVYNKISRLQPNSLMVAERLAELYKMKGSLAEAKAQYITVAEHYQSKGRMTEALAIWKQIAVLDANNTEVYQTIGEAYIREGRADEATEAFCEGAGRFVRRGEYNRAFELYSRALELLPENIRALAGYIDAAANIGRGDEAIKRIEKAAAIHPLNRDLQHLLIDSYLITQREAEAEKVAIKLSEREPSNYIKFLDIARHHISRKDAAAATRLLAMASEHLLATGRGVEFATLIKQILDLEPALLEALRLEVRLFSWQRDIPSLKDSLTRLAEAARKQSSEEDEKTALRELIKLVPFETSYAQRLSELGEASVVTTVSAGFAEAVSDGEIAAESQGAVSAAQFNGVSENNGVYTGSVEGGFAIVSEARPLSADSISKAAANGNTGSTPAEKLRNEIESIKFYVDNGYFEIAERALNELRAEFGNAEEINHLSSLIAQKQKGDSTPIIIAETAESAGSKDGEKGIFDLDEFRNELGLEAESISEVEADYETRYQTAVAYQEMGLLEQAIAEFQDAAALVRPDDGTMRFFQCASLLGMCFVQNGMPKLAARWYERALETPGLASEQKQAIWYELGAAFEAAGEPETAVKYYEQVYAENVDYRDVKEKLRTDYAIQ